MLNVSILLCAAGMGVHYKWDPEEKEVIAMKSDPLLLARRLWCVLELEVNPQPYH